MQAAYSSDECGVVLLYTPQPVFVTQHSTVVGAYCQPSRGCVHSGGVFTQGVCSLRVCVHSGGVSTCVS